MLDVHPPHHPAHSWKDFFLHIATIVVGLLIAIGLEQTVEALHHRHERLETRENLHHEITENRETLAKDMRAIASEKKMLEANMAALRQLRNHQQVAPDALKFGWYWNSMDESAWQTARETTALALFPNEQVQAYNDTYSQQEIVNQAGVTLLQLITRAQIPLNIEPNLIALTPAEIDELLRNCASALNQIEYLEILARILPSDYEELLRKF